MLLAPPGASEISGNEVIRAPASANIDPGRGGTYQITVEIKRVQTARLIAARIWLNSLQCVLAYKKGRFYCAVVPPKSNGAPRLVV
jgi:hypothetical protein